MPIIDIFVKNKIAHVADGSVIVCGNTDYVVNFTLDAEWDGRTTKTARFKWGGKFEDVLFTGEQCNAPKITNTEYVEIGVYSGDLQTTTSAYVPTRKSILCGDAQHDEPPEDVYNQIIELLNRIIASGGGGTGVSGLPLVTKEDVGKYLTVDENGVWIAARLPVYDGEYIITPGTSGTTLLTAQKLIDADIKIEKVPYSEVSNISNGTTVTIGG